jgi:hypothetical protein
MAGERLALQEALIQAFPAEEALRELLLAMDLKLSVVTTARSLSTMVLDVIEYVEARGRLDDLVRRACELRPQHRGLLDVVHQHWPEVARALEPVADIVPVATRRRATTLSDSEWQHLIGFIREKKCTPVIGPGVAGALLSDHAALATEWADRWHYPFPDRTDLSRVSQFLALTEYRLMPHEQMQQRCTGAAAPNFDSAEDTLALLADLDLPLYLTTSYDNFMVDALASRRRTATRSFPCWNQNLREAAEGAPAETATGPQVYHLFGHHSVPESMVLTEDDHFSFLASVASDPKLFPASVKRALGSTSLLFIGYGVLDWSFRVLLRALLKSVTAPNMRPGVAVQLPPDHLSEGQRAQVEKYLESFLNDSGQLRLRVFWGDPHEFTCSLRARWEEQRHAAAS